MLTAIAIVASSVIAASEVVRPAKDFVDSMGVCTHWSYPDTPYGFAFDKTRIALINLGIRHVRDGWSDRISVLARSGILTTLVCEPELGTPSKIVAKVRTANAALPSIDALEAPNEPDLFWVKNKKTYANKGWPDGPVAFTRDLWTAAKGLGNNRPKLYGIALGVTYDGKNPLDGQRLGEVVDFGNFHPYPGGNPFSFPAPYAGIAKYYWQGNAPSNNLDEWPYAFKTYGPPYSPKPMVATETGYSTNYVGGGVSEATHARYMPRLFAEYFRLGVARTFSYEFVDEFKDPAGKDRESHFGLLRHDLTPKPAYTALQSLIRVLADKGTVKPTLETLSFELKMPEGYTKSELVHRLPLRKSDGSLWILVWHEISAEDTSISPSKQLKHPSIPGALSLPGYRSAEIYRYGDDWKLTASAPINASKPIRLTIDDRIQLIHLSR